MVEWNLMIALESVKNGKEFGTFWNVADELPGCRLGVDWTFCVLVEASQINAKTDVRRVFLRNNDYWVEPFGWPLDWFDDSGLDLKIEFLLEWFEVRVWNVTESAGTARLSIWSEFDLGGFPSHATDFVAKDVWVTVGNFVELGTVTQCDALRRRCGRGVVNRGGLSVIQIVDLSKREVFWDESELLQDLATKDRFGDIFGDQEFDVFDEDVVVEKVDEDESNGVKL